MQHKPASGDLNGFAGFGFKLSVIILLPACDAHRLNGKFECGFRKICVPNVSGVVAYQRAGQINVKVQHDRIVANHERRIEVDPHSLVRAVQRGQSG